jgi:ubiquinone/menaquinone biosynthesis C-methylase UbiE
VTVDRYAGGAVRWAAGAALVYGPIARELIATSPRPVAGRTILDVGAGTGVASTALVECGARPVAFDLSHDMLAWNSRHRPAAAVADVRRLPVRDRVVDGVVAAFVFNHLSDPVAAMAESVRVTRAGGTLLACVFANDNRSPVRDALDAAAERAGWQVPDWYEELKQRTVPLLGTALDMRRVATRAGLAEVVVAERVVDVGVTMPAQLVDYRLGQAHFTPWLDGLSSAEVAAIREQLVSAIAPMMQPYQPRVVFLAATVAPA